MMLDIGFYLSWVNWELNSLLEPMQLVSQARQGREP